jgi:hypothetical protein
MQFLKILKLLSQYISYHSRFKEGMKSEYLPLFRLLMLHLSLVVTASHIHISPCNQTNTLYTVS